MLFLNKYYCLIFISLMISIASIAQNLSSPYSVYGIGDIDLYNSNINAGIGYTGIALKTNLFYNGNNPASAAGMEKNFLVADFNSEIKYADFKGSPINPTNNSTKDFTIKSASLAVKLKSFWSSGVGFRQFSNVNYQFSKDQTVEGGTDKYTIAYEGNGSLNEYYWNNAFNVTKHLSLGIISSFISGPINQTESFVEAGGTTVESSRRDYYGNWHFEGGGIYDTKIAKNWTASLGLKYAPKQKLNFERTLTVAANGTTVIDGKYINYNLFDLPESYGIGASISNIKGAVICADYYTQKWSALNYRGSGWKLVDANRFSAGAEFNSVVNTIYKATQTRSLQVGLYVGNSYLQVNNHVINDYGITAGIKRSIGKRFVIGGAFEYGVRGTTQDGLIKENYVKAALTLSFREFIYGHGYKFQ